MLFEKDGKDQMDRSFRNGEVLLRVKEQRNIVHTVKKRKANWIGHILRGNCLVTHMLVKEIWKGLEDEEDDLSSNLIISRRK